MERAIDPSGSAYVSFGQWQSAAIANNWIGSDRHALEGFGMNPT